MREASSDIIEVRLVSGNSGLEVLLNQKTLSFTEQTWMDLNGEKLFYPIPHDETNWFYLEPLLKTVFTLNIFFGSECTCGLSYSCNIVLSIEQLIVQLILLFKISLLKTQFYAFFCKYLNSQFSQGEIKKFILVWRRNISCCVEGLEALGVQL